MRTHLKCGALANGSLPKVSEREELPFSNDPSSQSPKPPPPPIAMWSCPASAKSEFWRVHL